MAASNDSTFGVCPSGPLISAYHDGELPAAQSAEVEAHVRTCPACAAELAGLRRFTGAFRAAPRPASVPPADVVLARVEQEVALAPASSPPPPVRLAAADPEPSAQRPPAKPRPPQVAHLRLARWLTAAAATIGVLATARVVYDRTQPAVPVPGSPGIQTTDPNGDPTQTQPVPPARRTTYGNDAPSR